MSYKVFLSLICFISVIAIFELVFKIENLSYNVISQGFKFSIPIVFMVLFCNILAMKFGRRHIEQFLACWQFFNLAVVMFLVIQAVFFNKNLMLDGISMASLMDYISTVLILSIWSYFRGFGTKWAFITLVLGPGVLFFKKDFFETIKPSSSFNYVCLLFLLICLLCFYFNKDLTYEGFTGYDFFNFWKTVSLKSFANRAVLTLIGTAALLVAFNTYGKQPTSSWWQNQVIFWPICLLFGIYVNLTLTILLWIYNPKFGSRTRHENT